MARGRTYELKAVFTAENKAGRTIASLERRLEKLNKQIEGMKDATVTFHTSGERKTAKTVEDIDKKVENMEKKAQILFEARKASNFDRTVKDAETATKRINKMRPRVMIGAHDAGLRRTLVNDEKLLEKFEKQTHNAMLGADDAKMRKTAAAANAYIKQVWEKTRAAKLIVEENIKAELLPAKKALEEMEKKRKAQVKLDNSYNQFLSSLKEGQARVNILTDRPYTGEIRGDIAHFNRAMKDVREQLDKEISRQNTIEVRARAMGFTELADEAREAAVATQAIKDVKVKVQEDGLQRLLLRAGATQTVLKNLDGTYTINIKADSATKARAAILGVGDAVRGYGNFLKTAQPITQAFAQRIYVAQQAMQVFSVAVMAVTVAALPSLVSGLTIALASIGSFIGGFGLIRAAAGPLIKHFQEAEQRANELESAENALATANDAVKTSSQGVADAQRGVTEAYRSGQEGIRSAIQAHKDSVQAVTDAQRASAEAAKGIREAEVQARQGVQSAIQAHEDAVRAVTDAQHAYKEAVRGIGEAERAARQGVLDAVQAHKDAIQGVKDAQLAYGDAVRGVAEAERSAHESVRSAIEAHRSALQSVTDAERTYADAQQAARDATQDVAYATKDYNMALQTEQFRLRSMQLDIQGMSLSQEQLALDMAEARREMMSAANPNEARAAELRYQQLQLQSEQNTMDMAAAQRELNSARKHGTDELQTAAQARKDALAAEKEAQQGVVDAMRALTEAQRNATKAEKEIARARAEGNRQIIEAQRAVAEAQRGILEAMQAEAEAQKGIGRARADGARQIRDAQRAAKEAHRGIAEAQRAEREAQRGITQARREGATAIRDAQRAYKDSQRAVMEAMREERSAQRDISSARRDAARQVADAQRALRDANKALADAQKEAAEAQREINNLTRKTPGHFKQVEKAVESFKDQYNISFKDAQRRTSALAARMIGIGEKALPMAGRAANKVVGQVNRAITAVERNFKRFGVLESVQKIFKNMPRITGNWTRAIGNFGGAFINIMGEAMPFARRMSKAIRETSLAFLKWTDDEEGRQQIRRFFKAAAPVAKELWEQIKRIGGGLIRWATQSKKGPQRVANAIETIGDVIVGVAKGIAWMARQWAKIPKPIQKFIIYAGLAHIALRMLVGSVMLRGLGKVAWWIGRWGVKAIGARMGMTQLGKAVAKNGGVWKTLQKLATGALNGIWRGIKWLGQQTWRFLRYIGRGIGSFITNIPKHFGSLMKFFRTVLPVAARGAIGTIVRFAVTRLPLIGTAVLAVWHGIQNTIDFIKSAFRTGLGLEQIMREKGKGWGFLIGNALRQGFAGTVKLLLQTVHDVIKSIEGMIRDTLNWIPGINLGDKLLPKDDKDLFQDGINRLYSWMRGKTNETAEAIGKNMQEGARKGDKATDQLATKANQNTERMRREGTNDASGWMNAIKNNTSEGKKAGTKNTWDLARSMNKANTSNKEDTSKRFAELQKTIETSTGAARKQAMKEMWDLKHGNERAHKSNYDVTQERFKNINTAIDYQSKDAKEKGIKHSWDLKKGGENAHTSMRDIIKTRTNEGKVWVDENGKLATTKGIEHAWDLRRGGEKAHTAFRDTSGKMTAEAGMRVANNTREGTEKATGFLGDLAKGVGTIAGELGITWEGLKEGAKRLPVIGPAVALADFLFASGGTYRNGEARYASGAKSQAPTGGVANGTTRVYGEVPGTTEYYITDNPKYRQKNMELLQQANQHLGMEPKEKRHHEHKAPAQAPGWNMGLAKGGMFNAKMRDGEARLAYGATRWESLWTDRTAEIARAVERATGAAPNTYTNHPQGYEERAPYSIDWWSPGGRGSDISTEMGNKVLSNVKSNYADELSYWLWNGQGSSPYLKGALAADPHTDHVHATFMPGLDHLGGASGSTGPDVDGLIAKHIPTVPNYNDGSTGKLYETISTKMRGLAVELIKKHAPATGSWSGGGNVAEWITEGFKVGNAWPNPSESQKSAMASRIQQESGGDPNAVNNWDSNAKAGTPSKGLVQIIEPTWNAHKAMYGADVGMFDENWNNPIKSVAVATRYMKNEYGHVVGANGQGYSHGGVATRAQLAMIGDSGPEVNMPLDDPRAVRMITKAFDNSKRVRESSTRTDGMTITQRQTGPGPQYSSVTQTDGTAQMTNRVNLRTRQQAQDGTSSAGNAMAAQTIARAEKQADHAIDAAMRELKEEMREMKEKLSNVGFDDNTMNRLVEFGVKTALGAIKSEAGKDAIDEGMADRLNFGKMLKGL